MRRIKIWMFVLCAAATFFTVSLAQAADVSVGEAVTLESDLKIDQPASLSDTVPVFGANLFKGQFSRQSQPHFNPNYKVAIGDTISVRIWGAFELELDIPVDSQGNIFIPKLGMVKVAGIENSRLIDLIEAKVRRKYNHKVFVYANVAGYQPVSVFVTGNVNRPGLYQGMSSDSALQFIDKAKGINAYGSFRNVDIVRNNSRVQTLDLYEFISDGQMQLFQFHNGDAIVVGDVQNRFTVTGDVKRPYMFELTRTYVKLSELMHLALPKATATNVTITRWKSDNQKILLTYALEDSQDITIKAGDEIAVFSDHTHNLHTITITGEHEGLHTLLVDKQVTLGAIVKQLKLTFLSDMDSVQLFRKSVAEKQKQLLLASLKELETLALTTSSVSKDEAIMRGQETQSILTFIDRAKKVEPKGQIVISEQTDLNEIYLEDGDHIFIPRKNNLVLVQGQVAFPGAHTYVQTRTVAEYIALAGDFGPRADKNRVLVIHQNGQVVKCDSSRKMRSHEVQKGDSVLVMPRLESKNLQITAVVTQILYQIAVATGVLLAI
jgi:protein involved in polysaccharide export with SLBB domain